MATSTIQRPISAIPVPVAQGGTGSTGENGARTNINAAGGLALNSGAALTQYTSTNKKGLKITFSGFTVGILWFSGPSEPRQGAYIVSGSTGTVSVTPILAASGIEITTATGSMTIKCTQTSCYAGVLSTPSVNWARWSESEVTIS